MPRPRVHHPDRVLDTAESLVVASGPAAVTIPCDQFSDRRFQWRRLSHVRVAGGAAGPSMATGGIPIPEDANRTS